MEIFCSFFKENQLFFQHRHILLTLLENGMRFTIIQSNKFIESVGSLARLIIDKNDIIYY